MQEASDEETERQDETLRLLVIYLPPSRRAETIPWLTSALPQVIILGDVDRHRSPTSPIRRILRTMATTWSWHGNATMPNTQ
jgi:hypothetical protein